MSARARERLAKGAGRIIRLVELESPPFILVNEVALMVVYALQLHPEHFGTTLGRILGRLARRDAGLCVVCGADVATPTRGPDERRLLAATLPVEGYGCPACAAKADEEFKKYDSPEDKP